MIGFLASRFIKDYQNTSDAAVRRAYGVLCGAVGIAINLLLFALKLFAGTLAGSVAVTADAFNNLPGRKAHRKRAALRHQTCSDSL